jgi:hypothetical protein
VGVSIISRIFASFKSDVPNPYVNLAKTFESRAGASAGLRWPLLSSRAMFTAPQSGQKPTSADNSALQILHCMTALSISLRTGQKHHRGEHQAVYREQFSQANDISLR